MLSKQPGMSGMASWEAGPEPSSERHTRVGQVKRGASGMGLAVISDCGLVHWPGIQDAASIPDAVEVPACPVDLSSLNTDTICPSPPLLHLEVFFPMV